MVSSLVHFPFACLLLAVCFFLPFVSHMYHYQWEPHWHCDVQHYTANAMKQTHDLNTHIGLQGCAAWLECYEANSGWHHNHSRCKMLNCYKKGYMLGAEQLAEASNLLLQ